jgi:hypothetical protein
MDIAIQVALIGALFTFFAGLLTAIVSLYRERLEKQKWARTIALDEQRFNHEKNGWALELTNLREMELFKQRLQEYPELFADLAALSSHRLGDLTPGKALALADKLNEYAYGQAGLCMLPDTRQAITILRNSLKGFGAGQDQKTKSKPWPPEIEAIMRPRTDLLELMRRDLGHGGSIWRDCKPLIELNSELVRAVNEKLAGSQSGTA